ncbi:MAG: 23S rRNA (pseudouridine(1915)-N(3))-methyltransferase RlmH, partial [Gammaproteobacteria bacterium]|nr:23S rRNA (pseudouridine(1915)-N(3))-methyltransferase RlmH [Gammaproteobacteria bacterium]
MSCHPRSPCVRPCSAPTPSIWPLFLKISPWELVLREIPPGKRGKNADLERIKEDEGERMLAMIQRDDHVIALEVEGKAWRTETLAAEMARWLTMGQRIILLVGGPEGLADACKTRAHQTWSLSPLTLPHPLVRILLAEQLYRAQTIL